MSQLSDELRTIWLNIELGIRKNDMSIVDRASARLSGVIMNVANESANPQ